MIEKNIDIRFITKYEDGYNFLLNKGFKVLKYQSIEDIEQNICGDCIVIDNYDINNYVFSLLRKQFKKLVYIDNINLFDYDVDDLVINSSISARVCLKIK